MREILLIARFEFSRFVGRRSTFVSLLLLPLMCGAFVGVANISASPEAVDRVTVVDRAHAGYFAALAEALERIQENRSRLALYDYAKRNARLDTLGHRAPALLRVLAAPDGDREALEAYRGLGGERGALREINHFLLPDTRPFVPPKRRWEITSPPQMLVSAGANQLVSKIKSYMLARNTDHSGDAGSLYAVVIPEHFGVGLTDTNKVQIWYTGSAQDDLLAFLDANLSEELRLQSLIPRSENRAVSLDIGRAAAVEQISADGNEADTAALRAERSKRFVPLGMAYLVLLVVLSNAGLLLGSVIEEKSTRVVEIILSCVSPRTLMAGKLLGSLLCALTILAVFVLLAVSAVLMFAPGGISFLSMLTELPSWQIALLFFYFLAAIVIYSSLYLAVGSMAATLQDAQSLMAPMAFIILLPFSLLSIVTSAPNGTIAKAMSWIPVYTPFFMMFRLPWHPPVYEIFGTALLIALTVFFLVRQMGRVFAANVLTTEKPPALHSIMRKMFRRG